jgi:hypothetical protein
MPTVAHGASDDEAVAGCRPSSDAGTAGGELARPRSIGEVLKMEVDEAVDFFAAMPTIAHPLQLLKDVGLGYLTLVQASPTLSGGQSQRIDAVHGLRPSELTTSVATRASHGSAAVPGTA